MLPLNIRVYSLLFCRILAFFIVAVPNVLNMNLKMTNFNVNIHVEHVLHVMIRFLISVNYYLITINWYKFSDLQSWNSVNTYIVYASQIQRLNDIKSLNLWIIYILFTEFLCVRPAFRSIERYRVWKFVIRQLLNSMKNCEDQNLFKVKESSLRCQ